MIGLEEIADRAALKLVFPPDKWDILIDDESTDLQDLAIVVRHPFKIIGVNPSLNANDENFLFPGSQNDTLFPNRRDLLSAEVQIPDTTSTFFVIVDHAKSRLGGRAVTDPRREGAAAAIVQMLEQRFDEKDFVLLGDFNDNPDDRSMNIPETGNPATPGGAEENDGPFLMNLMDALVATDHVSWGRDAFDIVGHHINTIDAGSRQRNNIKRGNDVNTGDDPIRPAPHSHADEGSLRCGVGQGVRPGSRNRGERPGPRIGPPAGVCGFCPWWTTYRSVD